MDKTILVIGGTGTLGQPVALKLKKAGYKVKIFTRDVMKARIKLFSAFDLIEGNVDDSRSLDRAMEGCYGVHINLQGGPSPSDIIRVEQHGTENIVAAARKNKIQKITYLSGSTVDRSNIYFAPTRAKYYAEQAIINCNIPFVIFRASWFMESLPKFMRNNKAMVIGQNKNKYHWLAADDYADFVVKTYETDIYDFRTVTVLGDDKYTIFDAMQKYCSVKHPDIKVSVMSTGLLKAVSFISLNRNLKFLVELTKYFEQTGENGYGEYINELLGRKAIPIEKWAKEYSLL